ncbi:MAG: sigma 54-interacting transcriptional regulator [Myxococcota bacterium]
MSPDVAPQRRDTVRIVPSHRSPTARLALADRIWALEPHRAFRVGSDPRCDLVLEDAFVSRLHLEIRHDEEGWWLTDLDSTNGTWVNGVGVGRARLGPRALLQAGKVQLRFETAPEGSEPERIHGMVVASPALRRVFRQVDKYADSPEPVVVLGPSGSGKEGIAAALHSASRRRSRPFVPLNCGALSPALVESELFGHAQGAFTGATTATGGAFAAAEGGTLFLDEIGELPLDLQPKLLRALETGRVRRVGEAAERPVTVRIIAATHRNLRDAAARGDFREDLFHRLSVLTVTVPSLAQRPEDIEALAKEFVRRDGGLGPTPAALEVLRQQPWPGNARELRNVMVRAQLEADDAPIDVAHLGLSLHAESPRDLVETDEREVLAGALAAAGGNAAEAARRLGVARSTLYDRLRRYRLR